MTGIVSRGSSPRRRGLKGRLSKSARHCGLSRRDDKGFTLVELLIVVSVLPVIVGALSVGLISVFSLQSSVSTRLSQTSDAQVVSSNYETDVQEASFITTQSGTAQQCGSGTQLLGLEWNQNAITGNFQTVVSYMLVQQGGSSSATYALVRQYCTSTGTTPISSSSTPTVSTTLSTNLSSTQSPPSVTCNVTSCNASSNWLSAQNVQNVTFNVTEPISSYSFSLVATPQSSSSVIATGTPQNTPTNDTCGYALAGTGLYASALCFVNFATLTGNNMVAATNGCLEMSVPLQGSYTLYFCVSITGTTVVPASLPTYSGAFLGNSCYGATVGCTNGTPFYIGIPGSPALYQRGAGTTVISLTNISVVNQNGVAATGWEAVGVDAETTDNGESISFSSNQPLTVLSNGEAADSASDPVGNACGAGLGLTGSGTTTVTCKGSGTTTSGTAFSTTSGPKNGTTMVWAPSPSSMTITLVGGGTPGRIIRIVVVMKHPDAPFSQRVATLFRSLRRPDSWNARQAKGEEGDTLVEVLVALMVLSLASVALIASFTTTISASAENKKLSTNNTILLSATQEAESLIQQTPSLFASCPDPISNYPGYASGITLPTAYAGTYTVQYSATNPVQYWSASSNSFTSTCAPNVPQLITIGIVGTTATNSFVVDYPVSSSQSVTQSTVGEQLIIANVPSSAAAGLALSPQPIVMVESATGQALTTDLSPVTLQISSTTATLSGCIGNEIMGVVSFSGCVINQPGTYTLTAYDGTLVSSSVSVSVGASANALVFTTQPVAGVSGAVLTTQPVIKVENTNGQVVTSYTGSITLTSSGGSLSGCAGLTAVAGVVTVQSCIFAGGDFYNPVNGQYLLTPYTLSASATNLISAQSSIISVTSYGAATQLVFTTQPTGVASANASAVFPTQPVVTAEDSFGNIVVNGQNASGVVLAPTLTASTGETIGGCSSTLTSGAFVFSGCHVSAYANGITLSVAASGLTTMQSTAFNVTGVPTQLKFTTQPVAGSSGSLLSTQPVLAVEDAAGNVDTAITSAITLTASAGSLNYCTNLVPSLGVITVASCTFAGVEGTSYTLTASTTISGSPLFVTSSSFTPSGAGSPTQIAFTTQPVAGASGSVLTTQPVLAVEDAAGNIATSASVLVSLSASGGSLGSCADLSAVAGVVGVANCTFSGLVGTYYTLSATATLSGSLVSVTSANFTPSNPGVLGQIVLSGCAQNVTWTASCTLSATEQDANGNVLTNDSATKLTFSQVGGTGSVTGLGSITASQGVATINITSTSVGVISVVVTGGTVTSNQVSFSVLAATQTITWTPPTNQTWSASSPTFTLSPATDTSGSSVTFASSTPAICTVNGLSVTMVTTGTCTITPTASANGNYTQTVGNATSITINAATQSSLALTTLSATYGQSLSLATSGGSDSGAVTYSVSSSGAAGCTINGSVLSATSAGTCSVVATMAGNATYNAVSSPTTTITFQKVALGVNVTGTQKYAGSPQFVAVFTGFVNSDSSSVVTGSLSCSTNATPSSHPGSYTVSACSGLSATNYTFAYTYGSLTLTKATPIISWSSPAGMSYGTALSSTQLNATTSVPGTFVYTPAAGTVLAQGNQTLSVTFTPTDTTDYNTSTATTTVLVGKIPPTITWSNPTSISYGTALSATQLNATASVPGTFVYTPASGTVLSAGTQTLSVTFTPTNTTTYATVTSTVTIAVAQITPVLSWVTPTPISYGTALSSAQLDATAYLPTTYAGIAGTFTYSPAAGTIETAGLHYLQVTFTPTDSVDYAAVVGYAALSVTSIAPTVTWATPASVPYGTALSATQLNATASVAGTFVYSPVAGTVPAIGNATLNVTFTPTDTTDYNTQSASVTLTVTKATPTITWVNPSGITFGTALSATQLNATASVPGTFVYSPASGTVLGAGTKTLSVTFTPTDTTHYNNASISVPIAVSPAAPTITWSNPSAITYGTALSATQLNATASVPGTFAYSPASGTVLGAGNQTLSVTFTPTDSTDYSIQTKSVSLSVTGITPTITWATPSAITYGTALSATQLNATASVPGTFAYSPASGTVLGAGNQTLSVTFTPTDSIDYSATTASVTLVVNKATPTINWTAPAPYIYGPPLNSSQLNATASVPGTFVYSPAVGTVLSAGGQYLSVTFTPTDTTDYTTASDTVYTIVVYSTPTITWATPSAITYGTALSATQLNATASVAGTFVYSPALGTVLAPGTQTLSVTFNPTNTTNYISSTSTVQLVVNKVTPTITWATPSAITYGTALSATQLNATASVPGTFAYSPASGTVLGAGNQTLSVTFTPTDTTHYSTQTASVTLVVNKATPTINWTAPAPYIYGPPLNSSQLNATASVPGTFVYSPAVGTVLSAGGQYLSVTFTPTDTTDYTTAGDTVYTIVVYSTPTITWATPSPITYGTALSATQLNATASVAGTFVYSPALGTVLNAGSQTLSVTFNPTNTTDYISNTGTVTLTVSPVSVASTTTISRSTATVTKAGEASEHFTVTVTGETNDGYPQGTVTVYSAGTALCSSAAPTTSGVVSTFTCSLTANQIADASYSNVYATFAPAATSSSVGNYAYTTSTSTSTSFSVVG